MGAELFCENEKKFQCQGNREEDICAVHKYNAGTLHERQSLLSMRKDVVKSSWSLNHETADYCISICKTSAVDCRQNNISNRTTNVRVESVNAPIPSAYGTNDEITILAFQAMSA